MMSNKEQGLIIVAKNSEQQENNNNLSNSNNGIPLPVSLIDKKVEKIQFEKYWLCVIKDECIVLNGICIDGNIYVD
ncbi:hypothetical protein RFI_40178 [Reticulomyxa filosa]|uniref:Uncharacterized protein n=1 Tax=Reticulomyxa filosa TaxID=46433 RepID=X6L718_RETFI|nr:hypothetical protein RFI_40178 [Reticulomyxa filosa]|eukprot:ETN97352.1 hypothetical protein RFI_40178 [Reticulomyxa filosa]